MYIHAFLGLLYYKIRMKAHEILFIESTEWRITEKYDNMFQCITTFLVSMMIAMSRLRFSSFSSQILFFKISFSQKVLPEIPTPLLTADLHVETLEDNYILFKYQTYFHRVSVRQIPGNIGKTWNGRRISLKQYSTENTV